MTLEVKIITKNKEKNYNLIKMNLDQDKDNIKILQSKNKKIVRKLSKNEIKLKKREIKEKKIMNKKKPIIKDEKKVKQIRQIEPIKTEKPIISNSPSNICLILERCNIETISDYLIKQSYKKDYPNIALKD